MTGGEALARAAAALRGAGIAASAREARLLLNRAFDRPPASLPDASAPAPESFWPMVQRRCAREPIAYITGRQGFWTLDLAVSRDTLIPRADSETLIEAALAAFADRAALRHVLDLGTGTGALLLAALSEFPRASGIGIDRAAAACALAARNARENRLAARAAFVAGDWAACLDARFGLVLANPPYIETGAVAALMPEVSVWEPRAALDGGQDGLDAYRAFVPDLPRLLAPGGVAVLEVGRGQAGAVGTMLQAAGLSAAWTRADLAGVPRAVAVRQAAG